MINLILGDCLEEMKKMRDKSVDLVLTDPPYGAGRDFANDKEVPIKLLQNVFEELYRICKDDCFLLHDWSRKEILRIKEFMGKWEFIDLLAVSQENTMAYCRVGFDVFQVKCLYRKGNPKVCRRGWNLYKTIRIAKAQKFTHPTMKQVDVYKKQVVQFSKEGWTILDPFMGSGTTGIACKELGRDFIGIEINKDYYEIAKKRIANTMESMF